MKIDFFKRFKRKKEKNIVDEINNTDIYLEHQYNNALASQEQINLQSDYDDGLSLEQKKLILIIGEDKINRFCGYSLIDKNNLSNYLLNLFKEYPNLIDDLSSCTLDVLKKINENNLTLEDVSKYKLEMLDLPIFSGYEKKIVDILRKKLNLTDKNYYAFSGMNFVSSVTTNKEETTVSSYVNDVVISSNKYVLPVIDDLFFSLRENKFSYFFPCEKVIYDNNMTIDFDNNTILVISYEDFLELSKTNLEQFEKYTVVLKENNEEVTKLSDLVNNNHSDNKSNDELLKINHLLYILDVSDLNDDRKKYYSYYIKKHYFDTYGNFFAPRDYGFEKMVNQLVSELEIDNVKKFTEQFNGLSEAEKNKSFELESLTANIFIQSLGDLNQLSSLDLLKKMYYLNDDIKTEIFSNNNIKNKLREGLLSDSLYDQYDFYGKMFDYISSYEFLSMYDAEFIKSFFSKKDHGQEYKLFVCLCQKDINETVKYILDDDKYFDEFFKYNDYFYSIFTSLDYDLLKQVVLKMEKNNYPYRFDFISSCTVQNQKLLLKEEFKDDTILKILSYMRVEVVSDFFMNNLRGRYLYKKCNVSGMLDSGVGFNYDIVKNKDFFDMLKSHSFVDFRTNINNAEKSCDPTIIEQMLKEYYDELINGYDSDMKIFGKYKLIFDNPDLFVFDTSNDFICSDMTLYHLKKLYLNNPEDKEEILKSLRHITGMKLSEIIIDALFRDNYYNVCLNIEEMLRFNDRLSDDEKILDGEKIEFYNMILNFDSIDNNEKISIYNKLKDKELNLVFYDDLRKLKDISYDKIKASMLNPINNPENKDADKSLLYGIDIYDYTDKEYTMLVRRIPNFRSESNLLRGCYSLISHENNQVYGGEYSNNFLYGYNTFDNDKVLHILETDSYSSSIRENASRYVNRIMTSREIVNSDDWYSEVQLLNNKIDDLNRYEAMKPDYLVVFDSINENDVMEAQRLNIPIVIITRRGLKKENQTGIKFDNKQDIYVDNSHYETAKKEKR